MTRAGRLGDGLIKTSSVIVILAAWEIISRGQLVSGKLTPDLVQILAAFWEGLRNGDLIYHGRFSVYRALSGFVLAILAGVPLGMAMARVKLFDELFQPLFSFGYPIPKIALYPIFIFVFGLGSPSEIPLIFLECLYPITVNSYYGARSLGRSHLWAARGMGARPFQIFLKVLVPGAAPYIFSGLRIALPVALIVVVMTEMIGDSTGLGYYIQYQAASFEYPSSYAGMLAIAIIGFLLDRGLVLLRSVLIFWETPSRTVRGHAKNEPFSVMKPKP